MDNLTHSLAGAVLGQMGLKKKTGLAMPALIIGANIPDIDAVVSILGAESLAIRRGITHGPVALVVLPIILTALLLAWAKWRPNAKRLPVHPGWLLAMAYIGTLSHPVLDWMNSYGIRFLEPFSSRWFAGDTLFIIDVWIWTALALAVWLSRRREAKGQADWTKPALAGFGAVCLYIVANGLITGRAEALTTDAVVQQHRAVPTLVVANPVPVTFWRREMLWRDAEWHGYGDYALGVGATLRQGVMPNRLDDPSLVARKGDPDVRAFLFWSRMPIVMGYGNQAVLTDQRFASPGFAALRGTGSANPFIVPLGAPEK
jgi:inner membrane protein